MKKLLQFLRRHAAGFEPYIGLAAVLLLFSRLDREGSFLTVHNILTVATQTVIVGVAAMGATCVIISGGIDLSAGSVIALTTVVTAIALEKGLNPLAAASLGVLVGGVCGLVSGLLVTSLRLIPFIATLGMMSVARGVAKLAAKDTTVSPPASWIEDLMSKTPPEGWEWIKLPLGVWLLILLAAVVSLMLHRTIFGRRIFAIGSNEAAARLCGLPVAKTKIQIYFFAGLCTGLAGLMQFARLTLGDPTAAAGLELDIIAAVVIGGASLSGGEGSVLGSLIGALILQFLRNGCSQIEVNNSAQDIIIGAIIIGTVAFDQLRKRWGT